MRVRGLKFSTRCMSAGDASPVAPHAGAWIEMSCPHSCRSSSDVAPHAGAWIEIATLHCGVRAFGVAPHAGAWIEIISSATKEVISHECRTPCGCVD